MNELFFVIVLVWLSVLTIAFLGITRHLATIQAASAASAVPEGGALLDADGPWIPSPLPDRVVAGLTAHGIGTDDFVATFFSSRCGSCAEKAEQIVATAPDPARNIFLVSGSDPNLVQDIRRILDPAGVPVIVDPDAQNMVKSLDIKSTPFAFRVVDRQVVGKSFVRNAGDYLRVADATLPHPQPITIATADGRVRS